jgi:hypothetical protein
MEIWNPYDGTIELILNVHPQESSNNGLTCSTLVAIKGKKRFRKKPIKKLFLYVAKKIYPSYKRTIQRFHQ